MFIVIISFPDCDIINFEINLIFLFKPFSYMTKKSQGKNLQIWEQKELSKWSEKHFSSFLKAFHRSR